MKKLIFLLVVVLLVGFQAQIFAQQVGQRGNPIRPYKENGYTKTEVKAFVLGDGVLNENYRREMLRIVNAGLLEAGEKTVFTDKNLEFLIDSCLVYKPISLGKGYGNSRRYGDVIDFYTDDDPFQGEVAIFIFGKCQLILYKTICMNLIKASPEFIGGNGGFQQYKYIRQPIWGTDKDTIIVNVINNIVINKDTIIYIAPVPPVSSKPAVTVTVQNGMIKWWHIVLPLGAMITGGVIYLGHRQGKKVASQQSQQQIPVFDRSMPPGLESTPTQQPAPTTPTNGGLDSDSRGMPGGLSEG